MELPPDWLDTCARLVSASILAALIGLERELRNKPAGLRTHILVGLGASALCVFAVHIARDVTNVPDAVRIDPIRVIQGVIAGLGFLGAGAIIQSKTQVHGMTTAAGVWIAGIVGVGCGTGNYFAVTLLTIITLICLYPIGVLERKLDLSSQAKKTSEPSM
jgi:putative Mg2+ transporter-C (MgtC) family protein